ncbi:IS110 family transposase [Streptomyces sp. NPDC002076]
MTVPELWAATDAGKSAHHCTVIDKDATVFHSRRVPNDETELLGLLGDVLDLADGEPVTWAVDLNAGGAALWIALLVSHGRKLHRTGRCPPLRHRRHRVPGRTRAPLWKRR